ncbi:MAG TPA: undecaprenyl-diphosphatase UppP [Nitrospirae bacterium]|nr:undecaprenyl-diphosphatase [bacterium BMS3Abin06]GBD98019.1 undecaprenyl-diphosphatase [bacterium BMS3Abin07]HDH13425.1 undecaprenyl-diphosphatase UppP [Nitrospirota bacterium]HDZ02160.1 undecaprenyl-diphosphatase UppP [Nitrospirota bacterium]
MLEAIILGIIQGLTEFLPVSSSAHLIIFPWFFNWQGIVNTLSFDIALHFGTLFALLIYFRKDWIELLKTLPQKDGLIWKLVIGTIPAAVAGVLLHDWVEQNRSPLLIVFTLCLVSIFMILSERNYKKPDRSGIEKINFKSAFFIGLAQACALIPGVSRSGITIVAGLTRNLKREDAARFSFLLGTPAIAGASLLELKNMAGAESLELDIFMIGITVSAVVGYFAIKYLMLFLQNYSLRPFAYYRFLLAFVIILSMWINA